MPHERIKRREIYRLATNSNEQEIVYEAGLSVILCVRSVGYLCSTLSALLERRAQFRGASDSTARPISDVKN